MKSNMILVADYPALKRAYTKAQKFSQEQFEFRGNTLVTVYAKYVLEYLKPLYQSQKTR